MAKKIIIAALILIVVAICYAATSDPWDGTTWDVTAPDILQPYGNHYKEMYDLRKGVGIRMNKEHETLAASSAGGVHKQGSARAFFQDSAPTTQIDGTAWDSGDRGSFWVDPNSSPDDELNILTDYASTGTWTPISTEIIATLLASNRQFAGTLTVDGATTLTGAVTATGLITANSGVTLGAGDDLIGSATSDITINTNKFTVAGATGNTLVAGTFTSTGVATLGDTSALATSGAPAADAQIANKKYVDDQDTADHPAYSGGESHTDGSGLIMKMGFISQDGAVTAVSFGTAFPNALISVTATSDYTSNTTRGLVIQSESAAGFSIELDDTVTGYYWFAVGH